MTETNYKLIELGNRINKIYRLITEIYKETNGTFYSGEKHFKQGPYGEFVQTKDENIIILKAYYGSPCYLQTYFGEINLLGSSGSTPELDKIIWDKLDKYFNLHIIEKKEYGSGPWYQINKIQNNDVINVEKKYNLEDCYKCKCDINMINYVEKKSQFKKYVLDNLN
jgi:hypothetical protein